MISKFRPLILNVVFFLVSLAFLLLLSGGVSGEKLLYGQSNPTNLFNFNQIFTDLGGPARSGDGGWHLRVASELASNNFVSDGSLGWLTSAPPGVAIAEGLTIKMFGYHSFGFSYLILICVLWAFAFTAFLGSPNGLINFIFRLLLMFGSLQFTGFSQWMLGPGVFFTEALSTPFVILSVAFLLKATKRRNDTLNSIYLGLASIFLGSASLVRANFVYISYVSIIVGIFLTFRGALNVARNSKHKKTKLVAPPTPRYLVYGIGSLVSLTPYYLMSYSYLGMPAGALNSTGFHLQYAWIRPVKDQFKTIGAGWLCEINEKYCQDGFNSTTPFFQYARQFFETLATFPFQVLENRLNVFARGWFSGEGPGATGSYDGLVQGSMLLMLICTILMLSIKTPHFGIKVEARIFLLLAIALVFPYLLTHVEVRFLIPIKLLTILFSSKFLIDYLETKSLSRIEIEVFVRRLLR